MPLVPTPAREEANDDDHETSNEAATKLRRSTRKRTAPKWYGDPVMDVMLLDNDEPTNYEEAVMGLDSEKWLEAMKSEIGSMYETKYGLWWTYPMTERPLGTNGSLRRKQMLMVMSPSIKLDLSQKVFGKFKGLTMMRLSHP